MDNVLVLVRHGESEWNKLNLFTGWTGIGWFVALFFSFLGKRQD